MTTETQDPPVTDEVAAARAKQLENMGVNIDETVSGEIDYFGSDETFKCYLPGSTVQYFEHKPLNDGQRIKYLNKTNHGLKVNRHSGDATLNTQPGSDRRMLVKTAIVGWKLLKQGADVPFPSRGGAVDEGKLDKVLNELPPHIIDVLEKDIRARNKWLNDGTTIEDIDATIAELQTMRAELEEQEAGKADSSIS